MSKTSEITRENEFFVLEYNNSTVPTKFAPVQQFAMFNFFVPEECDGLDMDVLFAEDEDGSKAGVPLYYNGTAWADLPSITGLEADKPVILQADTATGWYIGPRFSSAVTVSFNLYKKG